MRSSPAVRALAAVLSVGGCGRRSSGAGDQLPGGDARPLAPPPAADPRAARLPAVAFPLRLPSCEYDVRPPNAERLDVHHHADAYGPDPAVRALHLTFVGDPSRSMVVQWTTDAATLASVVRVVTPAGAARVEGYSFPLPGTPARRQHEVHLCGLLPGTRYSYVASADRAAAPTHAFVTAPGGPGEVRALVVGDARTDPQEWGRISRRALAMAPDVMLFSGDAVADGANPQLWDEFFAEGADLLAEVPGLWADGNHEGQSALYYDLFALPGNGGSQHHEHWYAATYGPLRVVVLNDSTVPPEEIAGPETTFLAETLRTVDRQRTPFVVTLHHQPMHTDAVGHLPDTVTRNAWGPLFDRHHVDLDLSGHVHNYESTEPLVGARTVAPSGTRYVIFGGAGAPLYPFRPREPWAHHRESVHGFGMLRATARTLRWEAYRDDGTLVDTIDVQR